MSGITLDPRFLIALGAIGLGVTAAALTLAISAMTHKSRSLLAEYIAAQIHVIQTKTDDFGSPWVNRFAEYANPRLSKAGWRLSPLLYLILIAIGGFFGFSFGAGWLNNPGAGIAFGIVAVLMPEELLERVLAHKEERLIKQLAPTVQFFYAEFTESRNVRSALDATAQRVPNPMKSLLMRTSWKLRSGASADEALAELGNELPTEYGRLFAQLLRAAWDDAAAGKMLPKLATRIVSQQTLIEKGRSAMAFQSLLGLAMNVMIVPAFLVVQWQINESFLYMTQTQMGKSVVTIAALSALVGIVMQRVIRGGEK